MRSEDWKSGDRTKVGFLGKVVEEKVATRSLSRCIWAESKTSWETSALGRIGSRVLTTAVIQMYSHLADAMERIAVRAESIQ